MLQRIQSVYLLVVASLIGCMYFLPIASINFELDGVKSSYNFNLSGIVNAAGEKNIHWPLFLLGIVIIITSFVIIFMYGNRIRQRRMIRPLILANLVLLMVVFWVAQHYTTMMAAGAHGEIEIKVAGFLPIVAFVFCLLASRAIKKDEELVRSADRLR